jgi:hypothetical protein
VRMVGCGSGDSKLCTISWRNGSEGALSPGPAGAGRYESRRAPARPGARRFELVSQSQQYLSTSGAKFAPGDRVICVEWFGEGTPPAPRWYSQRLSSELGAVESEYLMRSLKRVKEGDRPRDPGFAELPLVSAHRARELADNDLLYMLFGVKT